MCIQFLKFRHSLVARIPVILCFYALDKSITEAYGATVYEANRATNSVVLNIESTPCLLVLLFDVSA